MLARSHESEEQSFNTDHPFSFISGFLILPALMAILTFVMSIFVAISSTPSQLDGINLVSYYTHVFFVPYLIITMFLWIKKKRILPILMAIFFIIQALMSVAYMIYGVENEFMNVAVNTVWFIYFIRSNRVKQTFVK